MALTNRHNLPEEVVSALLKNRYIADDESQDKITDFSISSLIAPTQQTILKRRYPEGQEEDVIDRFYVLYGHLAHALLEEHGSDESITEKRFYKNILGRTISGQIDHYKDRRITDYKTVGAYKIKKGDFDEWSKQLNCYSLLVEEAGYDVDSIRIIAIIRDWSEANCAKERDYPQAPIVVLPLVKWSKEARHRYIEERVHLLLENEGVDDDKLPHCSDKERWMDEKDWAVIKVGATRAAKVFDNQTDAAAEASSRGMGYTYTQRMTPPRRCQSYCSVSQKCAQNIAYLKSQEKE